MNELEATRAAASPATEPAVVLAARGVHKAFRIGNRAIEVLHGATLELMQRERLCLMGSSGVGKSTLLHIVGLIEPPTQGTVHLQGQSAWSLSMGARAALRNRHVGFVFQAYHLLPDLNALENVVLPARIAGSYGTVSFDKRRHTDEAAQLLTEFGLGERLRHRPSQLSGGERQRVAIARALLLHPDILIADEPTGNLDTATGERVLDLLLEQQRERGLSLLLVTHDERLAGRCDRVLRMVDGRIDG